MVERLVRAAGADREGRTKEEARATGGTRPQGNSTVIALLRRRLGETLVGLGGRLGGTPAGHAADPAAAR
jgi:hypothetical protein